MDNTSYIALSRQMALQRQMTALATNIANMHTHGYKAQQLRFEAVLERAGEAGKVAFVQDLGAGRDLSPGRIETTGNPLDLAINGDGYFAVQTEAGVRYTRNGHFVVDADGALATSTGHALLNEGGGTITLPQGVTEVTVARDGTVSTRNGVLGRIGLHSFAEEARLDLAGDSLLASDAMPVPHDNADILQGRLEGSNVQPILEMTRMMETVRAFQNTQRLLETHHELVRRVVDRQAQG